MMRRAGTKYMKGKRRADRARHERNESQVFNGRLRTTIEAMHRFAMAMNEMRGTWRYDGQGWERRPKP